MATNEHFPYKWDGNPMVNPLLEALLKKDFNSAKHFIAQGMKLEDIEEYTFSRVLYEFIKDYDMMKFLVENGFNVFHFPNFSWCRDENNHTWGIIARAYAVNKQVIELLFKAGFDVFNHGSYWADNNSGNPHQKLWRLVFFNNKDKKFIDLMLSYGTPVSEILGKIEWDIEEPWYNRAAYDYVKNNPKIEWKGYSLHPRWWEEIPKPQEPHMGIFTSKSKKELLQKRYEQDIEEYEIKKRIQREFIESITSEEWELIEKNKQIKKIANEYWKSMGKT